jgi:AAA family ATP:ADP antiporter
MPASTLGKREFGRWRTYLWPIHHYELKKFIPMMLIFFLITFDYNVVRTMKDTLVVTAKGSGAEVIPFIKVWAMFPTSVLLTFAFTRLSNRFSRESVIYIMFSFFLIYFALFTFVLYPARHILHPHASADYLQSFLPEGCKGFIAMYRNWTFTTFYVMSELWGNIVLFLLFWGFANQITRIGEAKRFYGLFGIGGNLSGIAAGLVSTALYRDHIDPRIPFGSEGWEQTMTMLILLVLLSGVATLALFYWMNTRVLAKAEGGMLDGRGSLKERPKLSFRENFSYLLRSKYLLSLAFIVIAYNIVINLVEVVWKHEVSELYPNPADFNLYMNKITTIIGVVATGAAWFISGNALRKFGWTFTAMLTPIILLITSIGFFGCFLAKDLLRDLSLGILGFSPIALAVFFGSAQNVLSRSAKYSVFDATKEMAFIPLSSECKLKGKAAIDGVGARLGKSGGSVIHQALLLFLSSLTASAPYVALILLCIIGLWILAVRNMGCQFVEMTHVKSEPLTVAPVPETARPEVLVTDALLGEQKMATG